MSKDGVRRMKTVKRKRIILRTGSEFKCSLYVEFFQSITIFQHSNFSESQHGGSLLSKDKPTLDLKVNSNLGKTRLNTVFLIIWKIFHSSIRHVRCIYYLEFESCR